MAITFDRKISFGKLILNLGLAGGGWGQGMGLGLDGGPGDLVT